MLKDLDYQLFFIINSDKASKCHPHFRTDKYHFCSINKSADRYYPCIMIEKLYIDTKNRQISSSLVS